MDSRVALATWEFFIRLLKRLRYDVFDVWLHEGLKLMKRVTECSGHNKDCSRQSRRRNRPIEDIERLCGTRLGPGTLYGAIGRLEQQGWIKPLPVEERRQPYRITPEGMSVLRAKLTTLQRFAKSGLKRLELL
jgi:Transcriptional regulator PadR-like family